MRRALATRLWYAILAAVILVALIGQLVLVIERHNSIVNYFSYFTIESNMLVAALALTLVVRPAGGTSEGWRLLRIAALTGITVTGLVYGTLIAPHVHPTGADLAYTRLLHYLSPALAVLGFLLVGPRTRLDWRQLTFMAWPALWLAYTLIRAAAGGAHFTREDGTIARYPYGFIDTDLHGWPYVIGMIAIVTVLLLAIASLYVWGSRRLAAGDALTSRPTAPLRDEPLA